MTRLRAAISSTPFIAGVLLLAGLADLVASVLTRPLERFDDGITYHTVSFLTAGVVPIGDAYTPYGPGYGFPAVPFDLVFGPEALGLDPVWELDGVRTVRSPLRGLAEPSRRPPLLGEHSDEIRRWLREPGGSSSGA